MTANAPINALDRLLPMPRVVEVDHGEVAAPPEVVWQALRHGNLATRRWCVRCLPRSLRSDFWQRVRHLRERLTRERVAACDKLVAGLQQLRVARI